MFDNISECGALAHLVERFHGMEEKLSKLFLAD